MTELLPHAPLLDDLIEAGREFYRRGWMLATAGNLSARTSADPLRYAITASGVSKGHLRPEHFVELQVGSPPPAGAPRTSAETVVHERLYERFAPGAVLHIHGPAVTLVSRDLASEGELVLRGWEYIKALGFWDEGAEVRVPIVPNHHDLDALGRAVSEAAGAAPCVLVDGHGVYAWGDSVRDAWRHVEAIEFLCALTWESARAPRAGERPTAQGAST